MSRMRVGSARAFSRARSPFFLRDVPVVFFFFFDVAVCVFCLFLFLVAAAGVLDFLFVVLAKPVEVGVGWSDELKRVMSRVAVAREGPLKACPRRLPRELIVMWNGAVDGDAAKWKKDERKFRDERRRK